MPELILTRRTAQNQFFEQVLADGVKLRMMQIPGGSFLMGSPEDELERMDRESPQHQVTVPAFFMGKYPVTQAQWRAVAALPQIERELKSDPSSFKSANLPVEDISWLDAVEFCHRLSRKTGYEYRLPSEAEWEYACRSGTTTPFHFGETITTEVANYCGVDREIKGETYPGSYGRGPLGEYRQETTPVDYFGIANGFGLCDMHGNVWEWCLDSWHDSYQGGPVDGSAWVENDNDNRSHIIRGGSWYYSPGLCRSAVRLRFNRDVANYYVGFRLACSAPRA